MPEPLMSTAVVFIHLLFMTAILDLNTAYDSFLAILIFFGISAALFSQVQLARPVIK